MALIIKGDMPIGKGCDGCKFQTSRCEQMDACTCYLFDGVIHNFHNERHKDCPIIGEIPDEHGRLVDAEELCRNFTGECWENLYAYVSEAPTVLEASDKTETPIKVNICPHYQGVCGLDEDIVCYCQGFYEMCNKYREM